MVEGNVTSCQHGGNHEERKSVGHARVSSHTHEDDLERQIEMIKTYAERAGR